MDETGTKGLVMAILLVGTMVLGLAPIKLAGMLKGERRSRARQVVTSVLLCFGGGVLLATAFTHILPEVREGLVTIEEIEEDPIAEISLCVGFFLVYFVEELVHHFRPKQHQHEQQHQHQQQHKSFAVHSQSCEGNHDDLRELKDEGDKIAQKRGSKDYSTFTSSTAASSSNSVAKPVAVSDDSIYNDDSEIDASDYDFCSPSSIRDFVMVLALSFHAVFEGLAVGLADTNSDVWQLFGALCAHKFVIAFAFGMELAVAKTRRSVHFMYMTTFALMTLLGIGIGIAITETATEGTAYVVSTSVLEALAAGTLLYVAVFEVIQREREKSDVNGMLQLACCVVGFSCMMMVDLLVPHDHSHGSGDDGHSHGGTTTHGHAHETTTHGHAHETTTHGHAHETTSSHGHAHERDGDFAVTTAASLVFNAVAAASKNVLDNVVVVQP